MSIVAYFFWDILPSLISDS